LEPDEAAAEKLLAAAQADLETATRLNPQQVGAWNILSYLYYQRRDLVEANRAARSAYEADAFLASADAILYRLFVTSYDLELFTPATDWCQKGQRRFPNNPQFRQCALMLMSTNATTPTLVGRGSWRAMLSASHRSVSAPMPSCSNRSGWLQSSPAPGSLTVPGTSWIVRKPVRKSTL